MNYGDIVTCNGKNYIVVGYYVKDFSSFFQRFVNLSGLLLLVTLDKNCDFNELSIFQFILSYRVKKTKINKKSDLDVYLTKLKLLGQSVPDVFQYKDFQRFKKIESQRFKEDYSNLLEVEKGEMCRILGLNLYFFGFRKTDVETYLTNAVYTPRRPKMFFGVNDVWGHRQMQKAYHAEEKFTRLGSVYQDDEQIKVSDDFLSYREMKKIYG